ncbi:MAG: NAD(+)/NADH kinase [Terrimicrobiaceae bacterium]|nr:NAD(+)/NADH kinase [Terrimicrobiaceae bacterium]
MIGLIAHSEKLDARQLVAALRDELDRRGAEYVMERATAALCGAGSDLDEVQVAACCDLLVVLGGDGTILRVVHRVGASLRPIFGINLGSLGFLTCLGPDEVARAVDAIVTGDFQLSRRSLLKVELITSRAAAQTFYALNDVVISRGERSRLVKIDVRIDGAVFTNFNADGLIVSTPTGSTAYSLSAGGPILLPDTGVFVITPVCPHVLTNRSTVVSDQSIVEARLTVPGQEVFINVDGQASIEMRLDDVLRISQSDRVLPLAMLPERPFSRVLRQKLKWSGSNV